MKELEHKRKVRVTAANYAAKKKLATLHSKAEASVQ